MNTFFIWKVILLLIIIISVLLKTKNIENFIVRSHNLMSNVYGYTWTEDIPDMHYVGCIGLTESEYINILKSNNKLPFYSINKYFNDIDSVIYEVKNHISEVGTKCIMFISKEDDGSLNTILCFPDIIINKRGEKVINDNNVALARSYRWINQLLYNPYYLSNYCYSKNTIKNINRNQLGTDRDVSFSYCDTNNRISTINIGNKNNQSGYKKYYMNCGCTGEKCRCNKECPEFEPGCKININYNLCETDKKYNKFYKENKENKSVVPRQSRHFAVYVMPKNDININNFTNRSFMVIGQIVTIDEHTHLISENGMYTLKVTNKGLYITDNISGKSRTIINTNLSNYGNLLIENDRILLSDRVNPNITDGDADIKVVWAEEILYEDLGFPYVLQLGNDGNLYIWDNKRNIRLNI
jgi:hypothetical protein